MTTKKKTGMTKMKICRAIVTAWVVIVTTGIPAALSHGVVNYPYNDRNYTACLFLSEQGYNLVAFQVNECFLDFYWLEKANGMNKI